ncbi:hypothetical protein ACW9HJ_33600 [Nocardia gipuzkoensis]
MADGDDAVGEVHELMFGGGKVVGAESAGAEFPTHKERCPILG